MQHCKRLRGASMGGQFCARLFPKESEFYQLLVCGTVALSVWVCVPALFSSQFLATFFCTYVEPLVRGLWHGSDSFMWFIQTTEAVGGVVHVHGM